MKGTLAYLPITTFTDGIFLYTDQIFVTYFCDVHREKSIEIVKHLS